MSDPQTFARTSRDLGIAVTRQSILQTWQKLQEPWGDMPGLSPQEAARALGAYSDTMERWTNAFERGGLEALAAI